MMDKNLLRLPGIKNMMVLLAGLSLLQAFMILAQGVFLATAITASWHMKALTELFQPMLFFFIAFCLRHGIDWLKSWMLDNYASKSTKELRETLLQQIFLLGPTLIQKSGTGNVVTMTLGGIDMTENYITLILNKILNMMIIPWILLAYMVYLDWQAGVTLFFVWPIVILFMIILGYAAKDKADRQYAGFQQLSNHFVDALRGLGTLKLLGLSKAYTHNVYTISENYRKKTMSTLRIAILSTFALDFFTTLSIAVVALILGLALIAGTLPLYPALAILILAPEFFLPLRDFANDYHATLNGKNAMQAIFAIIDQPVPTEREALTADAKWSADSTLALAHINYGYAAERLDLKDISFSAKGFAKIGIIGASGSGKSTLINLLGGFLTPSESENGSIKVDDQTIPHLSQTAWQHQFLYLPQAPYLFHGSIGQNIAFYRPAATAVEIEKAAKQAGLGDWLKSLPAGLDTVVGEGARGVSGGQAQRIALARCFLDDQRRILIFDEPTAHLDIETEFALKETMMPLFEHHLVLFATHRLHWLAQMDQVLVLDHGQIVEQGTPAELQAKQGAYVALRDQIRGQEL